MLRLLFDPAALRTHWQCWIVGSEPALRFSTNLTPCTHARRTGNDVGYEFDYTDAGGSTIVQEFAYQNGRVRTARLHLAAASPCYWVAMSLHEQHVEHI